MGHGGKFISTPIPTSSIVTAYAALGNLRDAVKRTEELLDHLAEYPDDASGWEGLTLYRDRLRSRGVTLVQVLNGLIRSQEQ